MSDPGTNACTLISAGCTTGWLDQIHSELWLCPDGLLRRRLGLWATLKHGNMRGAKPTVDPENRPARAFDPEEIRDIAASDRRNHWITWEDVANATIKSGVLDHTLQLEFKDGSRQKFMWLRLDGGFDELKEALPRSLGSRFAV